MFHLPQSGLECPFGFTGCSESQGIYCFLQGSPAWLSNLVLSVSCEPPDFTMSLWRERSHKYLISANNSTIEGLMDSTSHIFLKYHFTHARALF